MLKTEKVHPRNLAYDRPSYLLISFLRKHYKLSDYLPQNNKYVIFNEYFKVKLPQNPFFIPFLVKYWSKNEFTSSKKEEAYFTIASSTAITNLKANLHSLESLEKTILSFEKKKFSPCKQGKEPPKPRHLIRKQDR